MSRTKALDDNNIIMEDDETRHHMRRKSCRYLNKKEIKPYSKNILKQSNIILAVCNEDTLVS